MPFAREKFFLGHSLVTNKFPKGVQVKDFEKVTDRKVNLEQFGLWDVATPNFNTFFPDVTAEDLKPNDDEFDYPIFRALSAIIINKWGPIDFSEGGVLKAAVKKLIGQTVYPNHEANVGNEVGVVLEAFWEKERLQEGFEIPAGINVRLKIDGKSNPKLVRSLNANPPSVHSVSVTVAFKWEKSHPELSDDQFWSKVGNYNDKGELIRRVVTEVFSFDEISFVSHGADPYAQKVNKDGDINNPAYADNHYQFTADEFATNGTHFDWKSFSVERLSFSKDDTIPFNNKDNETQNNNEPTMKPELLAFIIAKFNLAAGSTEAVVIAKLQEMLPLLLQAQADLTTRTTELATATTELTALKAKFPEGTVALSQEQKDALAKATETTTQLTAALKGVREDTLKFYHLAVGGADKADTAVSKMIAEASYEVATALLKQYTAQADKDHPLECSDCHSKKVSRASSAGNPEGFAKDDNDTTQGAGGNPVTKTLAETLDSFQKPKNYSGGIHGTETQKK